ncbi:MAG: glycosyl transferase family 2, partial [Verrucomicrobia bacterium]|nr:glycosyl transferase family 2 [Verrucomicrobiota bacterium]
DDEFSTELALSEMLPRLQQTAGGVVVGEIVYRDGRVYRLSSAPRPIARNFVHHQGAFYRRSLFAENGGFDTSFAIMADYEFNLRLWKNHVRFKPASLRIAECGTRGLSDSGRWKGYGEEIRARHRFFPAWRCWFWDVLSVVRFLRKQVIR